MSIAAVLRRIARAVGRFARMPPGHAVLRLEAELWRRLGRRPAGWWESRLDQATLLKCLGQPNMTALAHHLATRPLPFDTDRLDTATLDEFVVAGSAAVIERANAILDGWICQLGSGPIQLGDIDWHQDYKSGIAWPRIHYTAIDAADLSRPSDVKFPWDLSRLHWLLPVGQAYRLTGEQRYAAFARTILESWVEENPCAWGVNWACTMEPAMRVFSWIWLHSAFRDAPAWQEPGFGFRFLRALYLHLQFIRRNLEVTDINGNHLTADAAALVAGGAFFGAGLPRRWMATGWRLLRHEMEHQVLADGVDFEASTAYHRLVAELFHHAAASMFATGEAVPAQFVRKLLQMADYIRSYTRPDGLAPAIGDADDARVLPLGPQPVNDHRYLPQLIVARWAPDRLANDWRQSAGECLWWWGAAPEDADARPAAPPASTLFPAAGNAVLRSGTNYVFIDCGSVGLGGRGGHGHNDCLSFEAMLLGSPLVADPGCLVYTADWRQRNGFRATAAHSTPRLGEEEINRFVAPRDLWSLRDDARGRVDSWHDDPAATSFRGSHDGYRRLDRTARVARTLVLDKLRHALAWEDVINAASPLAMRTPLQLAPGVGVERQTGCWIRLHCGGGNFVLGWAGDGDWLLQEEGGAVAPTYGIALPAARLVWSAASAASRRIRFFLYPGSRPDEAIRDALDATVTRVSGTA